MAPNLRRLTSDHADLHNSGLPPHYLFPPSLSSGLSSIPDDLTQLTVLLTGPQGTPYSQGLWRLHLKIPSDYPKNPPKAAFRTRIWHPNVDEASGAVCVDTLKRDWEPKLTLRDVLITISCLLIHPNPDSALNSAAGSLLQDDYDEFARQARLMTSTHAPIPAELKDEVQRAKRRGDDGSVYIHDEDETDHRPLKARKAASAASVVMKKSAQPSATMETPTTRQEEAITYDQDMSEDDQENDPASESKENDPSLSPSLVTVAPPSPRRSVLGKRPLSVLATSSDPDTIMVDINDGDYDGDDVDDSSMTSSEKNIAANNPSPSDQTQPNHSSSHSHRRKSSKQSSSSSSYSDSIFNTTTSNSSSNFALSGSNTPNPFSSLKSTSTSTFTIPRDNHTNDNINSSSTNSSTNIPSKENRSGKPGILKQKQSKSSSTPSVPSTLSLSSKITKPSSSTLTSASRKLSATATAAKPKPKPRVGVRRL